MKNFFYKYGVFLAILLVLSIATGCRLVDKATQEAMRPITLNYWRVFDNYEDFAPLIEEYQAIHPNVTILYKKLRIEEYERELLNALAENRGPDIFSLHNTWMKKYQSKLLPLPPTITLAYQFQEGTIKKELVTKLVTENTLSLQDLNNNYAPVVNGDVVLNELSLDKQTATSKIYGLPLSVDTLALYYNKELLNNAGISAPPTTWKEFQAAVKAITRINTEGQIVVSAAALGTTKNVERYFDILSLLMMQNGSIMISKNKAVFDQIPVSLATKTPPALQALKFYLDFAQNNKEVYTWNESFDNSLDSFIKGKVAFFFGYAYQLPQVLSLAKMKWGVAPVPQIEGNSQVNYANYWVETVSKQTSYGNEAWDFVQFITSKEQAKNFVTKVRRPAALNSLLPEQTDDLYLGPFAESVPTAKSWYQGYNAVAVEKAFGDLIDKSLLLTQDGQLQAELEIAAQKASQTLIEP